MPHDIHVLLVSAQAAPNLLPTLDPAIKPREVVMLVSGKMRAQADRLQAVFAETGVRCTQVALADVHDFALLEAALLTLATERDGQSIALNVTGGTKLMALAAQSIAQTAGWPVFYVDADTDTVMWLPQPNVLPLSPHKLTAQLRLRHYLRAYGFEISEPQRPEISHAQKDVAEKLLIEYTRFEPALGQLNYVSQRAEDAGRMLSKLTDKERDSISLRDVLSVFQNSGFLRVNADTVTFTDGSARNFTKGGWLESHVFNTVTTLNSELSIRERACNLTVDAEGVKNEMDVAFLARNRLFVIECKTRRMDADDGQKANDALYKLAENCRRIGGLGTRGMLVTYRQLNDTEKRLASALGIKVAEGRELTRLSEKIRTWVNG